MRIGAILTQIRQRGYERPMIHGVIDISHPVFGFDGHIAAALTIPFLERIDGSHPVAIDDAQAFAADAAKRISAGLGWHGKAAAPR
ncbi:hypothetical protein [Stakelama marina]|uniref:IclR-ED domain-containing protein n=1 Tax=Stakelama marina TaxID=2826939 RepID=A0A8T4IBR0_9SPHN|nr:hypothetical protein [Stakelama marina]MBR0551264.1 hypothetical protein [Stakelama marina]